MVTDGGGFTLVWTFTFTKYDIQTGANDITPRPSWKLNKFMHYLDIQDVIVPVSNKPPTSEDQLGALKFKYWKLIGGNAFIVKSNFFNWISCNETTGSIVEEGVSGSIKCNVIKYLSTELPQCSTVTPTSLNWFENKGSICGMYLMRYNLAYMMFEVNSLSCWPIWDACGEGSKARLLKDIRSPRANVYIR
ncbi:unnamed protein product [Owenia fusiformis]|uniref:Uncharacterized protein n=2 Tax=Owenia fusiformis TaxID=6347 RepID=A0A8J1TTF3_OWEFU|nr:unnamed protein product [Owenia fusiformis]